MNVILREDIAGVGRRGDIVTVADGHARNYLLPRGLALVASAGAIQQANSMRRARDLRVANDRAAAHTVAEALTARSFTVKAKAGNEGRLFGSINAVEIAKAVLDQTGVTIDRKGVQLEAPLRQLGEHSVTAEIFTDVVATLKINLVAK